MSISKKTRAEVHAKYDGHCGYCGSDITIKSMQVDHMIPKCFRGLAKTSVHDISNLMPSCRTCNHYKRAETVGGFRIIMKTLHHRLEKIYIVRVGLTFGMMEIKPFDGTFYFEKINKTAI